ncbi:MAG: hypothetical protein WBM32_11515 [Crocosphaera sp.]
MTQQRVKTASFWNNLEKNLKQVTNLSEGINYLKDYYFDEKFFNQNIQ